MGRSPRTTFVIMAGGRGERLWPLVRVAMPKVCVSLDGRRTLLDETLRRVGPFRRAGTLLIVTTKPQAAPIRRTLSARFQQSLLVEPQAKNTAACIALSAAVVGASHPDAVMAVLPADHWIKPLSAFQRSLRIAIELARAGDEMVTIGVRPTRLHPGLGHLCAGRQRGVRDGCRLFHLKRLVEKPSWHVAQQLLRQRRTYWNVGVFIARVTTFLTLIRRWLPDHARFVFPLGELAGHAAFAHKAESAYQRLRAVSFDDGVMAHVREGMVVEGNFAWEDLGSWDSWVRIGQFEPPALAVASRNVRVVSANGTRSKPSRHLVASVGLEDAIVVRAADVTLICRTQEAQAVRAVAARVARDRRLSRYQ